MVVMVRERCEVNDTELGALKMVMLVKYFYVYSSTIFFLIF